MTPNPVMRPNPEILTHFRVKRGASVKEAYDAAFTKLVRNDVFHDFKPHWFKRLTAKGRGVDMKASAS